MFNPQEHGQCAEKTHQGGTTACSEEAFILAICYSEINKKCGPTKNLA